MSRVEQLASWNSESWIHMVYKKKEDILNGLDGEHTCLPALIDRMSSDQNHHCPFIAKPPASTGQIL